MSKSVQQLEAELAEARAADQEKQRQEREAAAAAKREEQRKARVQAEIADIEASIAHLQGKIDARNAQIAELKKQL